jgi:hypothetical protein
MSFRRLRLRVETSGHVIEGTLQLPTEGYRSRTTDYLNAHDSDFIALVDARVQPLDGSPATDHDYIAVNLRHAVLVVELEQLGVSAEPIGPLLGNLEPVPDPAPAPPPSSAPPPGAA